MKENDLISYDISTDPPKITSRSWKAYSTLTGGFVYMIFPGSTYITGNIAPYIASYFGVNIEDTSNLFLTGLVVNALFLPIGTYFTGKGVNPKIMISIGGAVYVILMFTASFTTNFTTFKILYPLAWSFNNGMAYYAAANEAWKFFPDKPGFASGIILSGYGMGAFFFDNISTQLINPNNYDVGSPEFNEAVKTRFVLMLRWLIVCFSGLILVGAVTIWRGPEKLADKVAKMKEDEGINTRLTDLTNLTSTDTPLKESVL